MNAPFVFTIEKPVRPELGPQIARALEKHVELDGRRKYPRLWAVGDRLNARKGGAGREIIILRTVLTGLLWLGSLGVVLPALMEPSALPVLLAVGLIVWLYASFVLFFARPKVLAPLALVCGLFLLFGVVFSPELRPLLPGAAGCLLLGIGALVSAFKKGPSARFQKAAAKLLSSRSELLKSGPVQVVADEDGLSVKTGETAQGATLLFWADVLWVVETLDLYLVFSQKTVILLQKEELWQKPGQLSLLFSEKTRLVPLF